MKRILSTALVLISITGMASAQLSISALEKAVPISDDLCIGQDGEYRESERRPHVDGFSMSAPGVEAGGMMTENRGMAFRMNVIDLRVSEPAFFCRIESALEKKSGIPFRFRLGSLEYTDRLEQKSPQGH